MVVASLEKVVEERGLVDLVLAAAVSQAVVTQEAIGAVPVEERPTKAVDWAEAVEVGVV